MSQPTFPVSSYLREWWLPFRIQKHLSFPQRWMLYLRRTKILKRKEMGLFCLVSPQIILPVIPVSVDPVLQFLLMKLRQKGLLHLLLLVGLFSRPQSPSALILMKKKTNINPTWKTKSLPVLLWSCQVSLFFNMLWDKWICCVWKLEKDCRIRNFKG